MFSRNLRERLSRRGAIARAEDATGISRVQLNRYLNGTIPNEANLGLLCRYLNVEEHELFAHSEVRSGEINWKGNTYSDAVSHSNVICSYLVYFEVPATNDYVVKSLINTATVDSKRCFVRYTSFDLIGEPKEDSLLHIHEGSVTNVDGFDYFQGLRTESPFEPSLMYLSRTHSGYRTYEGEALVWSVRGPVSLRIVAQKAVTPIQRDDVPSIVGALQKPSTGRDGDLIRLLEGAIPPDIVVS